MLSFIDSCGLITEYQFGFRKKRSTTDAIFEVIQFASSGLNKKEHVIYLFLDLKKAFDSVSHKILMSKLHKLGFRGNVQSFLKSYLSNRYQYVHINNYNSTLKNIKYQYFKKVKLHFSALTLPVPEIGKLLTSCEFLMYLVLFCHGNG